MTRLIDADKLWQEMTYDQTINQYCYPCVERIWKAIENTPTVDAVPVRHGKWIPSPTLDPRGFTDMFKCSECKRYSYYAYPVKRFDYKYCPHCGARMVEK